MNIVDLLLSEGAEWTIEGLDHLIETTLSGNIGGFSMPMGIDPSDPAMGGRKKMRVLNQRIACLGLFRRGLRRGPREGSGPRGQSGLCPQGQKNRRPRA